MERNAGAGARGNVNDERMDAISEALARMIRRQERVEARLDHIERAVGLQAGPAADAPSPAAKQLPEPSAESENSPDLRPAEEKLPIGSPAPAFPRVPPPLPDHALVQPLTEQPAARQPMLETRFGLNWLNRVGAITLLLGVGFFFKLAVDNQWIGPGMRVALGVSTGMAALSLGEWMSIRGQKIFARGMTGLGLGLLYLSFYASYGFYDLLPLAGAFLLMTATTAAAGALAFHYNSRVVAVLGLIGGFITPALLSTNQDRSSTITAYTLLLSLGALVLGKIRRWPVLAYLAIAGTYLLYSGWSSRWLADSTRPAAFGWLTLAFALFLVFTREAGLWLLPLNAALYFSASYAALNDNYHGSMGAFAAALGILHAAYSRLVDEKNLRQLSLAIAVAFVTIAVPIQFTGYRITIAWALEASACAWLARRLDSSRLEFGTGVLLTFVGLRLLGREYSIPTDGFWNVRLLTFAVSAAGFWIASRCLKAKEARTVTYCAGHIVLLWGLCLEISGWTGRNAADVSSATATGISILLTVYAIVLIASGTALRAAIHRLLGLSLIGIVILKLYLIDVWQLSRGFRIVAFLGLGAMLLLVSYLYSRFKPAIEKLWKNPAAENHDSPAPRSEPESGGL